MSDYLKFNLKYMGENAYLMRLHNMDENSVQYFTGSFSDLQ